MKVRVKAAALAASTGLLFMPTAMAEAPSGDGLSADQQAAIATLDTPTTVGVVAGVKPKGNQAAPAASARLQLYRGSFLMWARDTMTWYYDWSRVNSSNLQQEAGYVFPNTSVAKGVTRYYTSTNEHSWRGKYTIGAGTVTPWGSVNIYSADYSTDWHVYRNGAGNGRWN